jgi:hypothetical protein
MARTLAFAATHSPAPLNALRSLIVCGCALALIAVDFLR